MAEPLGERVAKLEEQIKQRVTYRWVLGGVLTSIVILVGMLLTLLQISAGIIKEILRALPKT